MSQSQLGRFSCQFEALSVTFLHSSRNIAKWGEPGADACGNSGVDGVVPPVKNTIQIRLSVIVLAIIIIPVLNFNIYSFADHATDVLLAHDLALANAKLAVRGRGDSGDVFCLELADEDFVSIAPFG